MSVMALHQERTMTDRGTTMNAIVSAQYGARRARAPRARQAGDRGRSGAGARARVVRQSGRVVRRDRAPTSHDCSEAGCAGPRARPWEATWPARSRSSARTSTEFQPGDEVFGTTARRLGRVRACPRGSPRAEAGQRVLRGSGRRPGRGDDRPPGAPRQGADPARAEGPDQRRVRRCRHLRRAARKGVRSGGDRRLQHGERGNGAIARRGPRRRLHAGGLHAARRPSRPDARHRRQPPVQRVQARADTQGDGRDRRSEVSVEQGARASDPHLRNASGRGRPEPDGQVRDGEDQQGGPPRPAGAARSREDEICDRQTVSS